MQLKQLDQIKVELAKYGQEHLLQFYDQLSPEEQNELLEDIRNIDFEEVCKAFKRCDPRNAQKQESIDALLEPLSEDVHQRIEGTAPEVIDRFRSKGNLLFCLLFKFC